MTKAICYGLLSAAVGTWVAFFDEGIGIVLAVSIIGVGIISELNKK